MTPTLRRKLEALAERREELERLLAEPDVVADNTRFRDLSREFASHSCSAVGSSCTWVSTKKNTPCWLITPVIAEVEVTFGSSGSTLRT